MRVGHRHVSNRTLSPLQMVQSEVAAVVFGIDRTPCTGRSEMGGPPIELNNRDTGRWA
jgi:hypothetical protein